MNLSGNLGEIDRAKVLPAPWSEPPNHPRTLETTASRAMCRHCQPNTLSPYTHMGYASTRMGQLVRLVGWTDPNIVHSVLLRFDTEPARLRQRDSSTCQPAWIKDILTDRRHLEGPYSLSCRYTLVDTGKAPETSLSPLHHKSKPRHVRVSLSCQLRQPGQGHTLTHTHTHTHTSPYCLERTCLR